MAFADTSTNNFQISAFGNAQISTSVKKYGDGSGLFDGNGDYLEIADNDAFELQGNDFTIEMWFQVSTLKGYQALISKSYTTADQNGWILYFETGGSLNKLHFLAGNGSWSVILNSNFIPVVGTWYHVALTRSGNTWRLYVDGDLKASTTNSLVMNTGNLPLFVGWYPYFPSSSLTQGFDGYIDDLRVTKGIARYTSNFTPPQQQLPAPSDPYQDNVSLLLHMDGLSGTQTFIDSSSNNFTLSAFGDAQISTSIKKFGSGAGYFGGGTNRVTIQDNDAFTLNDAFTIEAWIYPTQWNSGLGGPYNFIIAQSNNLANNNNRSWGLSVFSDKAAFYYTTDGVTDNIISFTISISLSTWTHVATSITSNGTLRTFVNGIQVGTASISLPVFDGTADVCIGTFGKYAEDGYPDLSYTGYIDELRITKGVARYTSNFVPHTAPFVNPPTLIPSGYLAFWKLDDLTDSSANGNTLTNNGSVQFVPGKIGNCAQFNVTNFLSSSQGVPTGDFTISYWLKLNTFTSDQVVGQLIYGCAFFGSGSTIYFANDSNAAIQISGPVNFGQWNHIVVRRSGNTFTIWTNGVLRQTQVGNVVSSSSQMQFGTGHNCQIDAFGLWNRELTQSEIDLLYNSGNGREP